MKLTMNRKGTFTCNWSSIDGKCGIGPSLSPTYTYHCILETGNILDPNGFVFDQLLLDRYFNSKYAYIHKPQSCEKIATTACEDIKRMVENHMLNTSGVSAIYRISVTIGLGTDGPASLTAEWVPDAAKQVANVKKVKKPKVKEPGGIRDHGDGDRMPVPPFQFDSPLMQALKEASDRVDAWPDWTKRRRMQ